MLGYGKEKKTEKYHTLTYKSVWRLSRRLPAIISKRRRLSFVVAPVAPVNTQTQIQSLASLHGVNCLFSTCVSRTCMQQKASLGLVAVSRRGTRLIFMLSTCHRSATLSLGFQRKSALLDNWREEIIQWKKINPHDTVKSNGVGYLFTLLKCRLVDSIFQCRRDSIFFTK